SSTWSRSLVGLTITSTPLGSSGGAVNVSTPGSYPADGRISPAGGSSITSVPSGAVSVSVVGSKSSRPARAIAITVSGEVTKASVLEDPSLRLGKLRLYEFTIVFGCPVIDSGRDHWPMQGPQALASTVAPTASRSASRPSRSIVARICSEPGVTSSSVWAVRPLAAAWRAIDATRVMSSYDEFVQEP